MSIVLSHSNKKILSELWTNKQPNKYLPKWEQSSSQQLPHFWCQKSERNPKGWGWVETKLLKQKHFLDQKNLSGENPPLSKKLAKMSKK